METWSAALVQMEIELANPAANVERALNLADSESERPDLVLLPELFSTGYALDRAPELARHAEDTLERLAAWSRDRRCCISGSVLHPWRGGVANAAFLLEPDGPSHPLYPKVHRFRLMDEHLHLVAGEGPVVWQSSLGTLAVATCYDLRFPIFCRRLARTGARALLVPAEWPAPRTAHWEVLLRARAVENQWFVLGANRVGNAGETVFEGASQIVDPWGEVLVRAGSNEAMISARLDSRRQADARSRIPVFADQIPGLDD